MNIAAFMNMSLMAPLGQLIRPLLSELKGHESTQLVAD